MRFSALCFLVLFLFANEGFSQKNENALLWQISGNGLKKPSYLFGTYHLLTNRFLDSLPTIRQKYDATDALVCEMLFDSTAMKKMDELMAPKSKTLDQLLNDSDYNLVSTTLQNLVGVGLEAFNKYNPMAVNLLIDQFLLQTYLPQTKYKETEFGMDMYFQKIAARLGKPVKALETVDVQMNALFGQFSEERQAEMLVESVKNIDKSRTEILQSITCYKKQDLPCLDKMLYDETYKPAEMDVLLYNRNRAWIKSIPSQINKESSFIAVGAGHLPGKDGLVEGLRKQGYTLTPVKL
jgi:uncharacterized protein YbaP (TraB family)